MRRGLGLSDIAWVRQIMLECSASRRVLTRIRKRVFRLVSILRVTLAFLSRLL